MAGASPVLEVQMLLVKVGSHIRNNDKRSGGRIEKVIAIIETPNKPGAANLHWAVYQGLHRRCRIRFDRIVAFGEPHHQHFWTLMPEQEADLA